MLLVVEALVGRLESKEDGDCSIQQQSSEAGMCTFLSLSGVSKPCPVSIDICHCTLMPCITTESPVATMKILKVPVIVRLL